MRTIYLIKLLPTVLFLMAFEHGQKANYSLGKLFQHLSQPRCFAQVHQRLSILEEHISSYKKKYVCRSVIWAEDTSEQKVASHVCDVMGWHRKCAHLSHDLLYTSTMVMQQHIYRAGQQHTTPSCVTVKLHAQALGKRSDSTVLETKLRDIKPFAQTAKTCWNKCFVTGPTNTLPFKTEESWSHLARQVPACRWRILSLPATDVVTLFIIPQKPVGLLCTSPLWNIVLWATAILKEQKIQVLRNKVNPKNSSLEDTVKLNSLQTDAPPPLFPPKHQSCFVTLSWLVLE